MNNQGAAMRTIVTPLFVILAATMLLVGCSKPWTHPDYSGRALDRQFKTDSLKCEVVSGEAHPLDKHKQLKSYEMCMSDLGWIHNTEGKAITFQTKPR
ncbi:hypothetical protein MRX56_17180 [Pseudodesulfovibrio sp. S3-i]|uniref:hypothetical protein n=1 Tax=Pseudodesulfovibrio sp. S3-i TaxID=2929474 RepID=UPI001FBA0C99|nr:hypothetical protein [Pseudodesulfovibrio sp. S3-i]MCJ2166299.1 hypothetical protein [Pseudodesulfovibrio sp. S3-i]